MLIFWHEKPGAFQTGALCARSSPDYDFAEQGAAVCNRRASATGRWRASMQMHPPAIANRRSCARHGHGLVRRKETTGDSDNNRSEGQGGSREALSTKEVRSKGTTVGTRTGSEAAMRAMSVRENAKSNRHRKTHRVEPGGTGRKSMHLTRGDLSRENGGGVSRGRSSEESRGNPAGAKGRRTSRRRSTDRLREA